MTRYFFDLRDGNKFFQDEEGEEFIDIEHAQMEAVASLADMAKDMASKASFSSGYPMSVEVRDAQGLLFLLGFTFAARNRGH